MQGPTTPLYPVQILVLPDQQKIGNSYSTDEFFPQSQRSISLIFSKFGPWVWSKAYKQGWSKSYSNLINSHYFFLIEKR